MLLTDTGDYPRIYQRRRGPHSCYLVMTPTSRPWYVADGAWRGDAGQQLVGSSSLYKDEAHILEDKYRFQRVEPTLRHLQVIAVWQQQGKDLYATY